MASESADNQIVSVRMPGELTDWLEETAAEEGVDREKLIVQLLASYRATEELEEDPEEILDIEASVREILSERIPDIADTVEKQLDENEDVATLETEIDRLDGELADVEASFQDKLGDVRERVIQVKREADAKASADHSHPELEEIETLRAELEKLEATVERVETTVDRRDEKIDSLAAELEDVAEIEARLDDLEEKLNNVAWIVSDLKDSYESERGEKRAIEKLKQRAAEEDVERAICDNCDKAVDIALLSEPTCPHCETTVTDVRLPQGFLGFGKPHLSVAKQLEAGDEAEDGTSDVPDAARR